VILPVRFQRGAVLILSVVLMAVMMALGLLASRVVVNDAFLTGNFEDREMAFQAAELGLDQGIEYVRSLSGVAVDESGLVLNCMTNDCAAEPPVGGMIDVPLSLPVEWKTISPSLSLPAQAVGRPQYFIERVAEDLGSSSGELSRSSASFAYGQASISGGVDYVFYRVTARNFNPTSQEANGRSFVVLQATVKRPF